VRKKITKIVDIIKVLETRIYEGIYEDNIDIRYTIIYLKL